MAYIFLPGLGQPIRPEFKSWIQTITCPKNISADKQRRMILNPNIHQKKKKYKNMIFLNFKRFYNDF